MPITDANFDPALHIRTKSSFGGVQTSGFAVRDDQPGPPPPPTVHTAQTVRDAFTPAELRAVTKAARTDDDVNDFLAILATTSGVDGDSPKLKAGIDILKARNLSTPAFEALYTGGLNGG